VEFGPENRRIFKKFGGPAAGHHFAADIVVAGVPAIWEHIPGGHADFGVLADNPVAD